MRLLAIERWLRPHESGTYVKFNRAGLTVQYSCRQLTGAEQ
jgi:hypothetical protein